MLSFCHWQQQQVVQLQKFSKGLVPVVCRTGVGVDDCCTGAAELMMQAFHQELLCD